MPGILLNPSRCCCSSCASCPSNLAYADPATSYVLDLYWALGVVAIRALHWVSPCNWTTVVTPGITTTWAPNLSAATPAMTGGGCTTGTPTITFDPTRTNCGNSYISWLISGCTEGPVTYTKATMRLSSAPSYPP